MDSLPALVCKNCSRPIWLPLATHPDTSQGLGRWPKGVPKRTFLCPHCKHLYEYSARDARPVPVLAAPYKSGRPESVACILLPCGAQSCAALLRIRTEIASDTDPRQAAPAALIAAQAHDIPCDRGHIQNGTMRSEVAGFDAYFDEEWKPG